MGALTSPAMGSWASSKHCAAPLHARVSVRGAGNSHRQVTTMGKKAGNGPFTPLVIATRSVIGEKEFNKLRGKGISLHSQVIKEFCETIGADNKQAQAVIRLAKKNGDKLGFLS